MSAAALQAEALRRRGRGQGVQAALHPAATVRAAVQDEQLRTASQPLPARRE